MRDSPHRANAAHPGQVFTTGNPHGEISGELATIGADGPNGTLQPRAAEPRSNY